MSDRGGRLTSADPLDFSGKRIVVTGGGGGIGRAVSELLLERGAQVVATDLVADALAPVAAAGAETVTADVASAAGRADVCRAAGRCDGLVIAHGTMRPKPIEDTTEADWDAIVGVNTKAPYFLCKDLGPLIVDGGAVVILSSLSGRWAASTEQSVYCLSKAAVSSVARSFAYAYAHRDVRVNAVLPGIVDTEMQARFLEHAAKTRGTTPEALHEARLQTVPLGRASPPRECAETVLWLLSPAAGYLTGQQIAVDGGMSMY
jgi:NAD(P)-dependent dehydrogenase (short-subunit alcohol dehydrogenase family)